MRGREALLGEGIGGVLELLAGGNGGLDAELLEGVPGKHALPRQGRQRH